MTASSNFGNMLSVVTASAFLPFLPMQPIQILFLNLLYDFSLIAIPWDNMDEEYLKKPRKWDASSIGNFMRWMGPSSSVFDILNISSCSLSSAQRGGRHLPFHSRQTGSCSSSFNSGWFGRLWSQTCNPHDTHAENPFLQSRASRPVLW